MIWEFAGERIPPGLLDDVRRVAGELRSGAVHDRDGSAARPRRGGRGRRAGRGPGAVEAVPRAGLGAPVPLASGLRPSGRGSRIRGPRVDTKKDEGARARDRRRGSGGVRISPGDGGRPSDRAPGRDGVGERPGGPVDACDQRSLLVPPRRLPGRNESPRAGRPPTPLLPVTRAAARAAGRPRHRARRHRRSRCRHRPPPAGRPRTATPPDRPSRFTRAPPSALNRAMRPERTAALRGLHGGAPGDRLPVPDGLGGAGRGRRLLPGDVPLGAEGLPDTATGLEPAGVGPDDRNQQGDRHGPRQRTPGDAGCRSRLRVRPRRTSRVDGVDPIWGAVRCLPPQQRAAVAHPIPVGHDRTRRWRRRWAPRRRPPAPTCTRG